MFFVAFEGGEGSGKSTQSKLLYERIIAEGFSSLLLHEPGGAVAATAALTEKINLKNKTVVIMVSGGNIDLEMFRNL